MAQQGDMWFRIMFDHRQAVAGMKLTSRELQELRVLSADLAGKGLSKLVPQFDKLTRLARVDGEQMKVVAASYGQLALQSREALVASRRFAQQLDFEADVLRERAAAGEKLSVAEQQRLTQNERISLAFQEGIDSARSARAKELLNIRKLKNAERDARQQKEASDRAEQQALKDKAAADKKYLADVKQNTLNREESERQSLAKKTAADKKYLASVKYNSQVMEDQRKRQLQKGQAFFDRVIQHKTRADKKYLAAVKYNSQIMKEQRRAQLKKGQAFFDRVQKHRADAIKKESIAMRQQTTAMSAMQKQLLGIAKQIAVVTIAYKTLGQVVDSIKLALDIEKAQKQFEIFLQSASDAEFVMDRIRRIAAETPLTISVSTQATRTLLQYGITAGEVTTRLRQLGDIAGGDTERMQRLSLAFGQITAAGRLQGQELRQLVEAGFNPLAEISRTSGESMLELKLRMAAGGVAANEISEALKTATTSGGRFAGQLERVASETTAGRLMLIAGALEEIKIESGELTHEMKPLLDGLIHLLQLRRFAAESGLISIKGHASMPQAPKLTFRHLLTGMVGDMTEAAAGVAVEAEKSNKNLLASLQDQTVQMITQFNEAGELLNITQEELKLKKLMAELSAKEMDAEASKLKDAYELLKTRKQEHELQQRAAEIARAYEAPEIKLQRQLQEVMSMQGRGMLPQGIARQETERLTQQFINAQVDKIVASQKEAAQVATKGSNEEFQIMRDIAMKNADSADSREETRHKARMEAQEALKNAVEALPEEISSLLPQAVAG